LTTPTAYAADVGRPKKRPEDRYITPARSFRPTPPELWDQAKAVAADNDETVTDVLNRALVAYVAKHGKREGS